MQAYGSWLLFTTRQNHRAAQWRIHFSHVACISDDLKCGGMSTRAQIHGPSLSNDRSFAGQESSEPQKKARRSTISQGAGPTLSVRQINILQHGVHMGVYFSKCSASIQIPHIQTALTKHIQVAALSHKMWQSLTVLKNIIYKNILKRTYNYWLSRTLKGHFALGWTAARKEGSLWSLFLCERTLCF